MTHDKPSREPAASTGTAPRDAATGVAAPQPEANGCIQRDVVHRATLDAPWTHPLDARATRRGASLGDVAGMKLVGVHLNVVAPGDASTALHRHEFADEFAYILEGEATLELDGVAHAVAAGDFLAFPAAGPAHRLVNHGAVALVYLVGGNRPTFDICDYPAAGKRSYVSRGPSGVRRQTVDAGDRSR